MKKIIALLLAVAMLLTLCACGGKEEEKEGALDKGENNQQTESTSIETVLLDTTDLSAFKEMEEVVNYLESFIDVSKYGSDYGGDEDNYRRDLKENVSVKMTDGITVGGTEFKFPLSYNEETHKIKGYEKIDVPNTNVDSGYGEMEYSSTISDKNNKHFSFSGASFDSLNEFSISATDEETSDFAYMKNITKKATPKTVVKTLGLPKELFLHKYVSPTGLISYYELRFIFRNEDETRQLQVNLEFGGDSSVNGLT